ncbi:MAG: DNA translocase FtsK 4TM domain-containing protein, partial [Gemmatimonadetes bacterium]|nr:DNA translocase FtsK 4TM domain-containing protein [Gemmatimonadota bacterium]
MVSAHQRRQLLGLALLTLTLFTALSLVPLDVFGPAGTRAFPDGNIMGVLGNVVFRWGYAGLGIAVLFVPVLLAIAGAHCFGWVEATEATRWAAFLTGLAFILPTVASFWAPNSGVDLAPVLPERTPGWLGRTLALPLVALLGWFGAGFVLLIALLALSIATIGFNPASAAVMSGLRAFRRLRPSPSVTAAAEDDALDASDVEVDPADTEPAAARLEGARNGGRAKTAESVREGRGRKGRALLSRRGPVLEDTGDPDSTNRPPVTLLSEPPPRDLSLSEGELDRLGEVLIRTLGTFKVEGQIAGRTTGPVVTQFEVVPAPGVKVNRIAALDADLALALRAPSIRIVAPIPG